MERELHRLQGAWLRGHSNMRRDEAAKLSKSELTLDRMLQLADFTEVRTAKVTQVQGNAPLAYNKDSKCQIPFNTDVLKKNSAKASMVMTMYAKMNQVAK